MFAIISLRASPGEKHEELPKSRVNRFIRRPSRRIDAWINLKVLTSLKPTSTIATVNAIPLFQRVLRPIQSSYASSYAYCLSRVSGHGAAPALGTKRLRCGTCLKRVSRHGRAGLPRSRNLAEKWLITSRTFLIPVLETGVNQKIGGVGPASSADVTAQRL